MEATTGEVNNSTPDSRVLYSHKVKWKKEENRVCLVNTGVYSKGLKGMFSSGIECAPGGKLFQQVEENSL